MGSAHRSQTFKHSPALIGGPFYACSATAEAAVDDVGEPLLFLDAAGLPQEDLHWFVLYTALLGEMDTSSHTHEELATLLTRYFYNGSIRLSLVSTYGSKE